MKKYNQNKHILLCNSLTFIIIVILIILSVPKNINSSVSKAANNTFTLNPPNSDDSNNYNVYKIQENTPKPHKYSNSQSRQNKSTDINTNIPKQENSNINKPTNPPNTHSNINKSNNNSKISNNISKLNNNSNVNSNIHESNNNSKSDNNNKLHKASNENIRLNNSIKITKLELSSHFIKLSEKKSISVSAIITPSKTSSKNLIWKSLDNDIAVIKNGKITGIKKGFTTIYVSSKDETIKAACSVKIE